MIQPAPVIDPPANVATGSTSSTMWVAFVRSAWSSIAAFCLSGLVSYQMMEGQMSDEDALRKSLVVAGISFFGPFAVRGGAEGVWDANRQKTGNATPADVTPRPIP